MRLLNFTAPLQGRWSFNQCFDWLMDFAPSRQK